MVGYRLPINRKPQSRNERILRNLILSFTIAILLRFWFILIVQYNDYQKYIMFESIKSDESGLMFPAITFCNNGKYFKPIGTLDVLRSWAIDTKLYNYNTDNNEKTRKRIFEMEKTWYPKKDEGQTSEDFNERDMKKLSNYKTLKGCLKMHKHEMIYGESKEEHQIHVESDFTDGSKLPDHYHCLYKNGTTYFGLTPCDKRTDLSNNSTNQTFHQKKKLQKKNHKLKRQKLKYKDGYPLSYYKGRYTKFMDTWGWNLTQHCYTNFMSQSNTKQESRKMSQMSKQQQVKFLEMKLEKLKKQGKENFEAASAKNLEATKKLTFNDVKKIKKIQKQRERVLREEEKHGSARKKTRSCVGNFSDRNIDLIYAKFNQQMLHQNDFMKIYTREGVCYTFNGENRFAKKIAKFRKVFKSGPDEGLNLIFNVNNDNYVYDIMEINSNSGIKFIAHSPYEPPAIESEFQVVGVGKRAYVQTSLLNETYLPHPWGHCDHETQHKFEHAVVNTSEFSQYSKLSCQRECKKRVHLAICGCLPYYYFNEETKNMDHVYYRRKAESHCSVFAKSLYFKVILE